MVDIDYYIAMGGGAYAHLSSVLDNLQNKQILADTFSELSSGFVVYMDVLSEINEAQHTYSSDILRQYEIWLRSGSKIAKKRLIAQGIYPQDNAEFLRTH